MIVTNEQIYRVGNVMVRSKDYYKSDTEKALKEGAQRIIARIICNRESDERITYYTN